MSRTLELVTVDARTLPLVQHLRYRVYVAEMGLPFRAADHTARLLVEDLDELGRSFAVFERADLVASLQTIPVDPRSPDPRFAVFALETTLPEPDAGVLIVLKLVSDPARRGTEPLMLLMRAAILEAKAQHARYIAITCMPPLQAFYTQLGFEVRIAKVERPPFGPSAVMVFDLADPRHREGKSFAGWMLRDALAG